MPSPTLKLYYKDAYIRQFSAQIIKRGTDVEGRHFVILDQTAFYPTSGGQPCDHGTVGSSRVLDVEITEDDVIIHYVDQLPSEEVENVEAEIDWERRFDHMQQHTGQHVLSAAFERLYDAGTTSFHLGKETVTVDIGLDPVTPEQLQAVEQLINQIVLEQRPVHTVFVEQEELSQYPLRNAPKVSENIRLVIVNDFDWSPCGGTHPRNTGEIGPIKIIGTERTKGATRVEFACGWRVLRLMQQKQDIIKSLQQKVSSGELELPDAVDKLLVKNRDLEKEIQGLQSDLLQYQASEMVERAEWWNSYRLVAQALPISEIKGLQALAKAITDHSGVVALLVGEGGVGKEGKSVVPVVLARSQDVDISMNTLLKSLIEQHGGKGGGSPILAQGGIECSTSPDALLDQTTDLLKAKVN
jgi:alanyl-tRNA synthetase